MIEVDVNDDGDRRVLVVRGEVDMESSPRLLEAIRMEIGRTLAIDLGGVEYIDSSGVAVLILGVKLARKSGTTFLLRNPSAQVRGVLELSQLEDFFRYDGTGEGAGESADRDS